MSEEQENLLSSSLEHRDDCIIDKDSDNGADTDSIEQNNSQQPKNYKFDMLFFSRLFSVLKILFKSNAIYPCWSTKKKARQNSLFWLYILFVTLAVLYEILVYFVGMIPSQFYTILTTKDKAKFGTFIIPCLLLVFVIAICKSLLNFMGGLFALKARELLTIHIQNQYLRSKAMYTLLTKYNKIDNPDQRITQDIEKFSETLRQIVTNLIIAPIMVVYYTYKCTMVTGISGPLFIYTYFVVGSYLSQKYIQPLVNAVFFKELQEGNFRYLHVRLRDFVESIAFCAGEDDERMRAQQSLDTLLAYQKTIVNKEFPLKVANESFSYLGSVLSYLIISIPLFMGVFDGKDASELSSIISANSFVAMYLIYLFSTILEQSSKVSDLAGYTARISELLETLNEINEKADEECRQSEKLSTSSGSNRNSIQTTAHTSNHSNAPTTAAITFRDVSLSTPHERRRRLKKLIVQHFNLTIHVGESVAIVGPNGSGKTSLLRALASLWPCDEGSIEISGASDVGKNIIYLPQTPYLIVGSLREQLIYPSSPTGNNGRCDSSRISSSTVKITDEEVLELLDKVHLRHLSGLIESYDTIYGEEWNSLLSPGERQRLAFARIFYWKPRFTVLDEATSAVDAETSEYFYNALKTLGTTIISVSHDPSIVNLHDTIVSLEGFGEYSIQSNTVNTPLVTV
ncbi:ATP-binding cassette sub-family D member 4 [Mycotypha africana]|uniref:ATP-binding cassette sub-family D member 4 n=1 Tax=Mycotypha africana TaxID=64632 RepID=UPI0023015A21|nr:ATP-binding cassette sub-family D member 4 [Mycotypha africana]KAI8987578.1 ATP-binding cassette sub-family D member 4 [Mycotypha africana]